MVIIILDATHLPICSVLQRVEAVMSGEQLAQVVGVEQQQQQQWQEPWGAIPTPHRP